MNVKDTRQNNDDLLYLAPSPEIFKDNKKDVKQLFIASVYNTYIGYIEILYELLFIVICMKKIYPPTVQI